MLGQFFRFLKCIPAIFKPLLIIHEADHSKPVSINIPRVLRSGEKEQAFWYPETSKSNPLIIAGRF